MGGTHPLITRLASRSRHGAASSWLEGGWPCNARVEVGEEKLAVPVTSRGRKSPLGGDGCLLRGRRWSPRCPFVPWAGWYPAALRAVRCSPCCSSELQGTFAKGEAGERKQEPPLALHLPLDLVIPASPWQSAPSASRPAAAEPAALLCLPLLLVG